MGALVDRVVSHAAIGSLNDLLLFVEGTPLESDLEEQVREHFNRADAIGLHARKVLENADPYFVQTALLDRVVQYSNGTRAEFNNFLSNRNANHLVNAQANVDGLLATIIQIPVTTEVHIEALREAAANYHSSISEWTRNLEQRMAALIQEIGGQQGRLAESATEISNQKQRLDTAIAAFQQQFSDAQSTRQTEHTAAEQARATEALKEEEARRTTFEESEKKKERKLFGRCAQGVDPAQRSD
ncbi:hypothetical protein [Silvimonas soli]|uniref:hypothetical protein n=1 Tax=Silvimonas soli TaxID=2980100 RepID=UPI0024B329D8|nr:hypothetical protein [Silvimonas soli]